MNSLTVLVQARMGSTRLPGKTLMPLWNGLSVLKVLLARLASVRDAAVVVATSTNPEDDAIESACAARAACFRGHPTDVLGRFAAAAEAFPARAFLRICADNPLADPEQISSLAVFFRQGGYEYAYNNRPASGLPDGLGAEIMTADCLRRLHRECRAPDEREHVTLHAFRHPESYRTACLAAAEPLRRPEYRLDVDYAQDLEFLRRLCAKLPSERGPLWDARDIIAALDSEPDLLRMRAPR